jgi:hypothetical protein
VDSSLCAIGWNECFGGYEVEWIHLGLALVQVLGK